MPNWCENNLSITGDIDQIKKFKTKAKKNKSLIEEESTKSTDICLQNLYPMPKRLINTTLPMPLDTKIAKQTSKELIKLYGTDNWYDWHCKHWGIKWDINATLDTQDKNTLNYYFDSPWEPPINAFVHISKDFPKLEFILDFEEPLMVFAGTAIIKNGKLEEIEKECT